MGDTGLPGVERFVAKIILKLGVWRASKESALKEFAEHKASILRKVARCSSEEMGTVVSIPRITGIEENSRHWSVGMTLDHLVQVNSAMGGLIKELLSPEAKEQAEVFIADYKPAREAAPDITEKFEANCQEFESMIEAIESFSDSRRHPHPWFGPMTAFEWLCLASMHMGIHRKQISLIIKEGKFARS